MLVRPDLRRLTRASNPCVYVVGVARSGTTLLQRMLNAHPQVAVVNETYWLPPKYRERPGLTRQGYVTPALFRLLLESPKFGRMGFGAEDLRRIAGNGAPIRDADLVRRLLDEYARRRDVCRTMFDWSGGERAAGQFGTWQLDLSLAHSGVRTTAALLSELLSRTSTCPRTEEAAHAIR